MVDITTILIGIVFFIIVLIIIVYFVYFNRTVAETSIITDNGILLSPISNSELLLTVISQETSTNTSSELRSVLILSGKTITLNSGELPTGAQGWIVLDQVGNEVTAFITNENQSVVPTTAVTLKTGSRVFLRNAYTGGYVNYSATDPNIYVDGFNRSEATAFIIEFDVNNETMALQSTLQSDQYLIPNNVVDTGTVTIAVPSSDSIKTWGINK